MQWLIDIITEAVIAAIGIPPTYIDRGTYDGADFELGDLTDDSAWHTLDLSAIVPAGASAVAIRIKARASIAAKFIRMRKHGTTMSLNTCCWRTQIANIGSNTNPVIGVDADRKIDYFLPAGNWLEIDWVIRGWWL